MATMNRVWVMKKYATGPMGDDNLILEERPLDELGEGEIRVRTVYLSLDPTNLVWLSPYPTYMPPMVLGNPARGFVIGVIEKSRSESYAEGDVVFGLMYWAEYCIVDPDQVVFMMKMPPAEDVSLEASICALTMHGHTAYYGMLIKGRPLPSDTVVVSGAAGATGLLAGQMARLAGGRVVGIAGGEAKCRMLVEEFGFDDAIDYKRGDPTEALAKCCPDGIDVFFDNVGGPTLDAVLANLAIGARIVICGSISDYEHLHDPAAAYRLKNVFQVLLKRASMSGMLVLDFFGTSAQQKCASDLVRWHREGRLGYRAHVIDGIENAFPALHLLFTGGNRGKLLVRTADFVH